MSRTGKISDQVFLGRSLDALSLTLERQTAEIFKAHAIRIPVRSSSLMVALDGLGEASAADLANALEQTHQLVSQKLPKLLRLGLIHGRKDDSDSRRTLYVLTQAGEEDIARLGSCIAQIDSVYSDLFAQYGDLHGLVETMHDVLRERSLAMRVND